MPFAADGTYTPPDGAENAVPGEVIRSATWNTIFTDISEALTQLGQGTFVPTPRTITVPGSFTVAADDSVILIEASAPTITIPLSASKFGPVKIMGAAASIFSAANSVVVFTGGENASGITAFTLNVDYQVLWLYPLTAGGYILD